MGRIRSAINELDPDQETIVICRHHGIRSRSVAMYLEQMDFTNVINLAGGVDRWAGEVDLEMDVF